MSDPITQWRQQFEAMARQFAATAPSGMDTDPMSAWAKLVQPASGGAEAMLERFSRQAQDYLALMRSVAESGAGKGDAASIARGWRDALAASTAGNPLLAALGSINGNGARTLEQMTAGAEAWLSPLAGQMQAWMSLPAFGPAREQQERLQQLARDQAALQQAQARFQALLLEAGERAFVAFERKLEERKLEERNAPGRQLDSARALYDLWIDAAEDAWSELALSPRFGQVFSALSDAQMRVRRGVQEQVERACGELGMPTRGELDSAHQRIHALTRDLRALRRRLDGDGDGADAGDADADAAPPRAAAPRKSTRASKPARPARKAPAPRARSARAAPARASKSAADSRKAAPARKQAAARKSASGKSASGKSASARKARATPAATPVMAPRAPAAARRPARKPSSR